MKVIQADISMKEAVEVVTSRFHGIHGYKINAGK